jgi:hippurate hydrolase
MFGRGGHGSRPETTVDPIVMAASTVLRLQTIVSREVAAGDTAVLTIGQIQAGTKNNIIPSEAVLGINIRTLSESVRARVVEAMHRVIRAEALASGADHDPEIIAEESFPVLVNDADATARVVDAFHAAFGQQRVIDPGAVTGSEDVSTLSESIGAPLVYWLLGGADAERFAAATAAGTIDRDIPSNHSPHFAPVIQPTLDMGVAALSAAALAWLARTAEQPQSS